MEKKRKFNKLDACIVVIILVLIFGAVYKFFFLEKTSKTVSMETIQYEMTIENLRDYAFVNLQVGDTMYDYTSGNAIGKIVDITWVGATDPLPILSGEIIKAPVENKYDAIVTLEAQATVSNGVFFVGKTYEICVNSKRKAYTKYADFTTTITAIYGIIE